MDIEHSLYEVCEISSKAEIRNNEKFANFQTLRLARGYMKVYAELYYSVVWCKKIVNGG